MHVVCLQYISTVELQTQDRESDLANVSVIVSQDDFCFDSLPADGTKTRAEVNVYLTDTSL